MSKRTLLSIGLALCGAAAVLPSASAFAAAPTSAPQPTAATPASRHRVQSRLHLLPNGRCHADAADGQAGDPRGRAAKDGGATRIKITGYSDDPKRPAALGQERADALKAQLIKEGVPETLIETQARIKSPPTKAGGPNPANHRARIALIRAFNAQVGPHDTAR